VDRMSKPKERAPAFQFYPRQFSGDDQVMAMDLDDIGAHILLMCNSGQNTPMRIVTACKYCPKSGPDGRRARVAITFPYPPIGRKVTPLVAMVFAEEFRGRASPG
jgi:hypothetical protein